MAKDAGLCSHKLADACALMSSKEFHCERVVKRSEDPAVNDVATARVLRRLPLPGVVIGCETRK